MVKIFSLCEIEKSLDEFHKFIHSKDGLMITFLKAIQPNKVCILRF